MSTKFDVYKDEDSPVIYDIDEERALQHTRNQNVDNIKSRSVNARYGGINLMRK